VGRDISVVIVTSYGLDGPRMESGWGWDFQHPSRPASWAHPAFYRVATRSLSRG